MTYFSPSTNPAATATMFWGRESLWIRLIDRCRAQCKNGVTKLTLRAPHSSTVGASGTTLITDQRGQVPPAPQTNFEGSTQLHGGGIGDHIDPELRSVEEKFQDPALFLQRWTWSGVEGGHTFSPSLFLLYFLPSSLFSLLSPPSFLSAFSSPFILPLELNY